ncbi:MAG: ribose-phosphate pyrophosphokinase [bacterium]
MRKLRIFSGNSNPILYHEICRELGIEPGCAEVREFSDGEISVEIEENIRGLNVFVLQSICKPSATNLMELLIMMDALKRASASTVSAVIPYYGYARQDRKVAPRAPISAKLVADLITVAGATRVLCLDLHAGQIQGFFNIPVDNLFATPVLLPYIRDKLADNLVVVAPDAGGVERARAFAKRLDAPMAIIDKRRDAPNQSRTMNIIGNVRDCRAVIIDDIVDTAGTLVQGAQAVQNAGAREVYACCSHGVLSGPALERIHASCLEQLVITNSIPPSEEAANSGKIKVLSVARLLAEAIKRTYFGESVSGLFI